MDTKNGPKIWLRIFRRPMLFARFRTLEKNLSVGNRYSKPEERPGALKRNPRAPVVCGTIGQRSSLYGTFPDPGFGPRDHPRKSTRSSHYFAKIVSGGGAGPDRLARVGIHTGGTEKVPQITAQSAP